MTELLMLPPSSFGDVPNIGSVDSHPIKDPTKIDTEVQTDKGARYGLVIAEPTNGDAETQKRLLDKLKAYIGDFHSPAFFSKYGEPTPEHCKITVGIHPLSDPTIFELLDKCRAWVEGNNIAFNVRTDIFDLKAH